MTQHSVRLPYPDRTQPTVASCAAGDWTITYQRGGHEDAAAEAGEHVGNATLTHPVQAVEMSGEVLVMPGRPVTDLTEFLLARIAEDEAVARAAVPGDDPDELGWVAYDHHPGPQDEPGRPVKMVGGSRSERDWLVCEAGQSERAGQMSAHIARWDPARVLAECEAKRRIVELHSWTGSKNSIRDRLFGPAADEAFQQGIKAAMRLLALPYVDHPDWREEWRAADR